MSATSAVLIGIGGFGRELIGWAEDAQRAGDFPQLLGYVDDDPTALSAFKYHLPYLGTVDSYAPRKDVSLVLGVSDPKIKQQLVAKLSAKGGVFASLTHPTAVVARSAKIGIGVILCPHSLVSADALVADFVTVNALSSIGHNASVGKFTTLSAHVDITGAVVVGEGVFFGSGARVMPNVRIGADARIGAGALIVRSVDAGATMIANHAKRI